MDKNPRAVRLTGNAPRRIAPGAHAPRPPTPEPGLVDTIAKTWCKRCHDWATARDDGVCLFCVDKPTVRPAPPRRVIPGTHGSEVHYRRGCRCVPCTQAAAAGRAERKRRKEEAA